MYKLSKDNVLTSFITVIIFSFMSIAFATMVYPFTNFFMKDILLLIGIVILAIGALALTGTSSSSQIINPFVKLTPITVNNIEEITKKDIDIENEHSHYLQHSVYLLKKSTFEFAVSGGLLILIALI